MRGCVTPIRCGLSIGRWLPLFIIVLFVSLSLAQDASRTLSSGVPVVGILDAETPAQVYNFTATMGDSVSLAIASDEGLVLTAILTDGQGNILGQSTDATASGQVLLAGVEISTSSIYYVTIFPAAGVENVIEGNFTLTLLIAGAEIVSTTVAEVTAQPEATSEATSPVETTVPETFSVGQTLLSGGGIQADLRWNSDDDLNLQVRDPAGETLFWDSRITNSGGTFGFDVNGLCEVLTATDNVETASWPVGPVATGSYEVLVYYRQSCGDTSDLVNFTLDISVNGVPLTPVAGNVLPPLPGTDSVYITSFKIVDDGSATAGLGGPYIDTRTLDVAPADLIEQATQTLTIESPVTGLITNEQPYQTYRFDGTSGQAISISMTRDLGSLDTLLLILDSAGNVVDGNDDIEVPVNTNSALNLLRLPATDTYTIVASRYGKTVGGTEGTYSLVVSGQTSLVLPQEVVNLNLPQGDIQITLTWNTGADLRLLVRDPALNSIFNDEPTSPTGGRLQEVGNLNCTPSLSTTPVSYIYWPPGLLRIGSYEVDVFHRNECSDTAPVTFNLYVSVLGQLVFTQTGTLTLGQRYLTSFNIADTEGNTAFNDGGLISDSTALNYQADLASAVSVTTDQRVTGTITNDNTFDLYTFEGQAGDVVTVSLNNSNGNLDPLLYLVGPNGIEIANNDDSNETTNSLISSILLTEDGTYTVIATRFGAQFGGTTGAYNLLLRIDRP